MDLMQTLIQTPAVIIVIYTIWVVFGFSIFICGILHLYAAKNKKEAREGLITICAGLFFPIVSVILVIYLIKVLFVKIKLAI